MNIYEPLDPNETVFPQDVSVADKGGANARYGGLTKRELFALTLFSAVVQKAGIPPSPETAAQLSVSVIAIADGLLAAIEKTGKREESPIVKPGPTGIVS